MSKKVKGQHRKNCLLAFIERCLNDPSFYQLIRWTDKANGIFQVLWVHAGRSNYHRRTQGCLFDLYREYRGRGMTSDPKQAFRMALKKSPCIMALSGANSPEDWKIFKIIQKCHHDDHVPPVNNDLSCPVQNNEKDQFTDPNKSKNEEYLPLLRESPPINESVSPFERVDLIEFMLNDKEKSEKSDNTSNVNVPALNYSSSLKDNYVISENYINSPYEIGDTTKYESTQSYQIHPSFNSGHSGNESVTDNFSLDQTLQPLTQSNTHSHFLHCANNICNHPKVCTYSTRNLLQNPNPCFQDHPTIILKNPQSCYEPNKGTVKSSPYPHSFLDISTQNHVVQPNLCFHRAVDFPPKQQNIHSFNSNCEDRTNDFNVNGQNSLQNYDHSCNTSPHTCWSNSNSLYDTIKCVHLHNEETYSNIKLGDYFCKPNAYAHTKLSNDHTPIYCYGQTNSYPKEIRQYENLYSCACQANLKSGNHQTNSYNPLSYDTFFT